MAPRWFNNIRFGRDQTNLPPADIIDHLRAAFADKVRDLTLDSTGPIIEEIPYIAIEESPQEDAPQEVTPQEEDLQEEDLQEEALQEEDLQEEDLQEEDLQEEDLQEEALQDVAPQEVAQREVAPQEKAPQEKAPQEVAQREVAPQEKVPQEKAPQKPVRRSTRRKWAPLDFARGERPIYRRRGATFELAGFEPGFPTKTTNVRQAPKPARRPAHAVSVEPITLKQAKKGDYLFQCERINSIITGAIRLAPGKSKPEAKTNHDHQYLFLVRKGHVTIKTADKTLFADENSGWIALSQGKYSLKNCGSRVADVVYIITDK